MLVPAVFVCTGCVPFRAYDIPAVTGNVRDSVSAISIPGAQVTVTSLEKPSIASTATTDADGQFQVKEVWHHVWLLPLPYDFFYPDAAVTVSAAGHKSLQTTVSKLHRAEQGKTGVAIQLEPQ
ncbi:MAG TPA: carboxypeptidase-like regulatory domain-containing protein [Rhizomicrobium sp.]|nr:carboxypeptidase-like regulatory domain-containing protein [Rhizomicrobium sp.]